MYEYSDGNPADGVEGGENVTGWIHVEPVDCIPFADHDESLQNAKKALIKSNENLKI